LAKVTRDQMMTVLHERYPIMVLTATWVMERLNTATRLMSTAPALPTANHSD
jgi:hypothetical protein